VNSSILAREAVYKKFSGDVLLWEHFFCFVSNAWEESDKSPKFKVTEEE
jgi:hypothetical protein